jgi:hypothetical protein
MKKPLSSLLVCIIVLSTCLISMPLQRVYAADGKGNALSFDGTSNYVSLAAIDNNVYTFELWFNPATTTNFALIGSLRFLIQTSGTSLTVWHDVYVGPTSWSVAIGTGSWHHLAVVIDYSAWQITPYLDSIPLGTKPTTTNTKPPIAWMTIGSYGAARYFAGSIDEVRIYDKALSHSEVLAHRNSGVGQYGRPETGLSAGWHFDETSGNTAHDYSGNGLHGTVIGTAMWVEGIIPLPDIEISSVTTSANKIEVGGTVEINVTANNLGTCNESFQVAAYYGNTAIDTQSVTDLAPGSSIELTFNWATTGIPLDTYTIKANATAVEGETNTANNEKTDGTVWIVQKPAPDFDWLPKPAIESHGTTFDASSTNPYGGTIVNYQWNFGDGNITAVGSPTIVHVYASHGDYEVTLTVTDSEALTNSTTKTVQVLRHDVAVTAVVLDRNWVYESWPVGVNITVVNRGNFTENVQIDLYYNGSGGSEHIDMLMTSLDPSEEETLTYTWDTTGVAVGPYYNVTAVVSIPIESDPSNNEMNSTEPVKVRLHGDINGDDYVGIDDILVVALHFGERPGDSRWNPDADFTRDGYIGIDDIFYIAQRFGDSC